MTAPFCEIETGRLLNFDLRVFQMVINFFRGTAVNKFLHRKTAIKSIPARFIILLNNPQNGLFIRLCDILYSENNYR